MATIHHQPDMKWIWYDHPSSNGYIIMILGIHGSPILIGAAVKELVKIQQSIIPNLKMIHFLGYAEMTDYIWLSILSQFETFETHDVVRPYWYVLMVIPIPETFHAHSMSPFGTTETSWIIYNWGICQNSIWGFPQMGVPLNQPNFHGIFMDFPL